MKTKSSCYLIGFSLGAIIDMLCMMKTPIYVLMPIGFIAGFIIPYKQ